MRGNLIVIEGIDGTGKATQAKLLIQALEKLSSVAYFDFPRYETSTFGKLLGECLKGDHGPFLELNPYIASLAYMADRASAARDIRNALDEGYVVCNRYTTSNVACQSAKLPSKEQKALINFIEVSEYEELRIPKPDFVIFLYMSPQKANELLQKKGERGYMKGEGKDVSEADREYQQKVADVYFKLAKARPNWHVIDCMEGDTLLTPQEIHYKVLSAVLPQIDPKLLFCELPQTVHK